MLPHEADAQSAIATKYQVQLEAMTKLHDAVVGMLTAGDWRVTTTRGVNRRVAMTMLGLLTKAVKTFRAVQILCERGLYEDANALARILMETTVAILFILQKKSDERARIFHAYSLGQTMKMLNEWTRTKGLKRMVSKAMLLQGNSAMASYVAKLPPGTDIKRHWSGTGSLQEAMSQLKRDSTYSTLYRYTSSIVHVADFGAHFSLSKGGEMFWEIEPQLDGFEAPSYAIRQLLWAAASRIDEKFGLGFEETLAPFHLTREDVRSGEI